MNIMIKSSSGISQVALDTKLMDSRKLFIEGEITQEIACEFSKKVMILSEISDTDEIKVMINSPGGEINAGMLMYDVIQDSKVPIKTYCIGRAYSMAAILFACGKHGRYMLPHSELMIHEPLIGGRIGGNSSSIKSISDTLLENKRNINNILAKHTGKSVKEVEEASAYDHYFTPEESINFGLCDEIINFGMI